MATKNKNKLKRVTMEESLYMRFLYVEKGVPVFDLMKRFPGYSRATIFRHVKRPVNRPFDKRKLNKGRPKKLSLRDERNIVRQISRMRSKIGPFTLKKLAREAGIAEDVSMSTISRVLRKHGFRYLHSRRKGIMKPTDFTKRMKFARTALKYPMDFWTKNINFYFDGTGFIHKHNPHDEARSTKKMAWKKKSEGLNPLYTTKGKRAGTGGWMAHFMVALSPGRGVVLCHQYQGRSDGKRFASMVCKLFQDMYKKTEHFEGRLFLQDGCPVQNSAVALTAMKGVKQIYFQFHPAVLILTQQKTFSI